MAMYNLRLVVVVVFVAILLALLGFLYIVEPIAQAEKKWRRDHDL